MKPSPEVEGATLGLRERKKRQNMAALQAAALRLFATQGYEATTVEQIADAADVSPSTFFRYFSTKEAVVLYDGLDPVMMTAFARQPQELSVIAALRKTMREVFDVVPAERLTAERQRSELIRTVPELRARMLEEMARGIDFFADIIAGRTGRPADSLAVRNLAGAIIGVGMAVFLQHPDADIETSVREFDEALGVLESGLSL